MRRTLLRAAAAVALLAGSACSVDKVSAPVPDIATTSFASSLNVSLDEMTVTSSGLYLQDVVLGDGAAVTAGKRISVAYVGRLANGSTFDSSTQFSTLIGVGEVIKGWDEGLIGMRVGGTRRLILPPALGYGSRANGQIPANSILVFDVQLLGVE